MEIRVILDPQEVRQILEKTGEVVIRPTLGNVSVDARTDRRGRPQDNPPQIQASQPEKIEDAPAPAPAPAPAKKRTAPASVAQRGASQAEVQTALAQHAKKNGRDVTRAILEKYGKTVADVAPKDYDALLGELNPPADDGDGW